jgi:hypothetical protein
MDLLQDPAKQKRYGQYISQLEGFHSAAGQSTQETVIKYKGQQQVLALDLENARQETSCNSELINKRAQLDVAQPFGSTCDKEIICAGNAEKTARAVTVGHVFL